MNGNGNAPQPTSADLLVQALNGLAQSLNGPIARLQPSDPQRGQLMQARTDLMNAAADIDADALMQQIQNNQALNDLKSATAKINALAQSIAASQAGVAKVAGIGTAAVSVATAIATGGVPEIVSAVQGLLTASA